MTNRLIGSGPIRPPVRPSKDQSGVLQAIDHSVAGSMTAQPPGFHPSALQVATHGQQMASFSGGLIPLQTCNRRILQPQPTGRSWRENFEEISRHIHLDSYSCVFFQCRRIMWVYIYIYICVCVCVCVFYYHFTPGEFFTPALTGCLSLESERQVSTGLKDSSQYSG